jgi:hypothetical protein
LSIRAASSVEKLPLVVGGGALITALRFAAADVFALPAARAALRGRLAVVFLPCFRPFI